MTRIPPHLPVEAPESAARMRRVEDKLFSQRSRWRDVPDQPEPWYRRLVGRELKLAGAFTAAMCATAFFTWQLAQPTTGAPEAGAEVVVVPDGESQQVELANGVVQVHGGSTVRVDDDREGAVKLDLRAGEIDCELSLEDWRSRFFVSAGDIQVSAVRDPGVSPSFTVKRSDSVKVVVEHGTVVVTAGDIETYVSAGQDWNSAQVEISSAATVSAGPG